MKRSVPRCGHGSNPLLAWFQRCWELHGTDSWLLQWPVRALVLLLVAAMPSGVELSSFSTALGSALLFGLLGTLLIVPLKLVLALL